MTRALNWQKAKRDGERSRQWHADKTDRIKVKPGPQGALPPTQKQLRYLAALSDRLGRRTPVPMNRKDAMNLITQFKQNLAVKK